MKIEIINWGPIQRCNYDLSKALIVTYGENNIGKSYAMQVMYLLLKNMIKFSEMHMHMGSYYQEIGNRTNEIEDMVKSFVFEKEEDSKDITEKILFLCEKYLERMLLTEFRTSLENTFGTYNKIMEEKPIIKLYLDNEEIYTFLLHENRIKADIKIKKICLKKVTSNFHKSRKYKDHYDIYVYENYISAPVNLIRTQVLELMTEFVRKIRKSVRDVYFLPASRSGIYTGMSSFGPIMAQISQNRAFFNRSFQIPSIPEPISDYYMELASIKSDRYIKYEELACEIEETILNGKVEFDSGKKAITYQGKNVEQALEMKDVSSMVSEISPIVAYLKYVVSTGVLKNKLSSSKMKKSASIVFIEEPEAHLHPLNQIKLMKTFVKLSKSNVNLVIASHSNYIFNELNNRVIAGELDKNTYSPLVMKMENRKSNTRLMDMDEFGVSDTNFADASTLLYEEREELVLNLMERLENEEK